MKSDCPLFTRWHKTRRKKKKKARASRLAREEKMRRKEEWTKMLRGRRASMGLRRCIVSWGCRSGSSRRPRGDKGEEPPQAVAGVSPRQAPRRPGRGPKNSSWKLKLRMSCGKAWRPGGLGGKAVFSAGRLGRRGCASALQEKAEGAEKKGEDVNGVGGPGS